MRIVRILPRFVGCLCLAILPALTPRDAAAQRGALVGVVRDTGGVAIPNADVGVVGQRKLGKTDENGRFAFERLSTGEYELSFRRLGYEPLYMMAEIRAGKRDSISVRLRPRPLILASVNVASSEMRRRENVEDFYRRRVTGVGQYITREEVEKRWGGAPSDLLRNTPGLRLVSVGPGVKGVRFPTTSINRRNCAPMIWIDGQKANGMEIDEIPLNDIEGIELYSGPSTTPLQFSQSSSQNTCGTIVVWSRPPTPRRP